MEKEAIPADVRSKLRHQATWHYSAWYLTVTEVMGIVGCGDTRAKRYRAIILAELTRDYPNGPKKPDGSQATE